MSDILEIGSRDVNGTLRFYAPENASYTGIDIESGPGVDIVVSTGHSLPFDDNTFDLVLASSVFEHDLSWWKSLEEMFRVCKGNGYVYISAPSNGPFHRHPLDLFRFYPDAGISMVKIGKDSFAPSARLVESFVAEQDPGGIWNDFVCVLAKSDQSFAPTGLIYPTERSMNVWVDDSFLVSTQVEISEDGRQSERLRQSEALGEHLSQELNKVYDSVSWKITSPLRRLWRGWRKHVGT